MTYKTSLPEWTRLQTMRPDDPDGISALHAYRAAEARATSDGIAASREREVQAASQGPVPALRTEREVIQMEKDREPRVSRPSVAVNQPSQQNLLVAQSRPPSISQYALLGIRDANPGAGPMTSREGPYKSMNARLPLPNSKYLPERYIDQIRQGMIPHPLAKKTEIAATRSSPASAPLSSISNGLSPKPYTVLNLESDFRHLSPETHHSRSSPGDKASHPGRFHGTSLDSPLQRMGEVSPRRLGAISRTDITFTADHDGKVHGRPRDALTAGLNFQHPRNALSCDRFANPSRAVGFTESARQQPVPQQTFHHLEGTHPAEKAADKGERAWTGGNTPKRHGDGSTHSHLDAASRLVGHHNGELDVISVDHQSSVSVTVSNGAPTVVDSTAWSSGRTVTTEDVDMSGVESGVTKLIHPYANVYNDESDKVDIKNGVVVQDSYSPTVVANPASLGYHDNLQNKQDDRSVEANATLSLEQRPISQPMLIEHESEGKINLPSTSSLLKESTRRKTAIAPLQTWSLHNQGAASFVSDDELAATLHGGETSKVEGQADVVDCTVASATAINDEIVAPEKESKVRHSGQRKQKSGVEPDTARLGLMRKRKAGSLADFSERRQSRRLSEQRAREIQGDEHQPAEHQQQERQNPPTRRGRGRPRKEELAGPPRRSRTSRDSHPSRTSRTATSGLSLKQRILAEQELRYVRLTRSSITGEVVRNEQVSSRGAEDEDDGDDEQDEDKEEEKQEGEDAEEPTVPPIRRTAGRPKKADTDAKPAIAPEPPRRSTRIRHAVSSSNAFYPWVKAPATKPRSAIQSLPKPQSDSSPTPYPQVSSKPAGATESYEYDFADATQISDDRYKTFFQILGKLNADGGFFDDEDPPNVDVVSVRVNAQSSNWSDTFGRGEAMAALKTMHGMNHVFVTPAGNVHLP
ncbi:hypothetical protein K491DRAFT_46440 [Lophiostoma macrostomum CBS 122681]|uniref:MCM3-like winged helix domain-containing protein n=1 Tax=Lophiostoma macrostomum CBS 122681 TaxID=1314788 RepID=A0A6A6SY86_9PLEO|nr:hypothetical protein K491DRAFT_46440 [Lophiostoma macrostomum CBS 122681]